MNQQLAALDRLAISTVPTPDEVWTLSPSHHIDSLHPEVCRRLVRSMNALSRDHAPITAVVQGERGSGKTHLLGWTRQEIHARGGFFFYIKLVTGWHFWESATGSMVDSLYRKDAGGQEQLLRLLDKLSRQAGLDDRSRAAITGQHVLQRAHVDAFVRGIRRLDRQVGNEAADTARALVLLASSGDEVEIGKSYLALNDDELGQRAAWGLSSRMRPAQLVLRDLTRIFALVGPLVFAFDQLDNLISVSETSLASASSGDAPAAKQLSGDIASGLMELREEARRTLMVIACQPDTWQKISRTAIRSALDRFDVLPTLGAIPDQATAAAIVSSRFQPHYKLVRFTPPYPTWPISLAALAEAPHRYTARRLLDRVAEHIAHCTGTHAAMELTSLARTNTTSEVATPTKTSATELAALTELFEKHCAAADVLRPLDKETEDSLMPVVLGAGFQSLVKELGGDEARFVIETNFGGKAALHVRFRYIVIEGTENEIHWSIRAIAADNAKAAQNRIRDAVVEAGLEAGLASRRLILLRNTQYPSGAKTDQLKDDFLARGGLALPIGAADLRTFAALRAMLDSRSPNLDAWLKQERPASRTEVFATILSDLRHYLDTAGTEDRAPQDDGPAKLAIGARPVQPEITIGTTTRGSRPFIVAIDQLRKHTVVVGAAGSGKTVLVKRIVEQCALHGVSAIVLDPNDDLGRLGDPWPNPPQGWTDDQEDEARRYFSGTEVVIWTPGLNRGRPLAFHPLPDFGPVLADADNFGHLLTSTVATLAPQAGIRGNSGRATQQLSLLRRVLDRYVRNGGRTLAGLVELLAEPPGDLVNSRTSRFAGQLADTLEAAMDTDPLFGDSGTPADPGALLTPSAGKSARISVISFVGLSGDGRARFVSRLQAELFSWFRTHPAGDRPLGGLLVMDEAQDFVPSGRTNPSAESTVELIRQIRKYGLGVVLASQAPKGIHHEALGNTANQFIGRLTAPAQIDAAQAMAYARNSNLDNLGGLSLGTFFAAGEGTGFSKTQVPICLSQHAGPLAESEIVERAHRSAVGP